MDTSFYNTISLTGDALKKARDNASLQEAVIAAIFNDNPGAKLSPSMIMDIFVTHLQKNVPITSVRRGLTNLTTGNQKKGIEGILEKTPETRIGPYGLPEHLWKLKKEYAEKLHVYKPGEKTAADFATMLTVGMKQQEIFKD